MTTTPTRHPLDPPRLILAGYVYTRINGKVTRRYAMTIQTRPALALVRKEETAR